MMEEESTWHENLAVACKYAKTLRGGGKRPEVFTPDILSGIGAMAFEHVLTAMVRKADDVAAPHNLVQKVSWLQQRDLLPEDLSERACSMGRALGSCGTGGGRTVDPEELGDVVEGLIKACV